MSQVTVHWHPTRSAGEDSGVVVTDPCAATAWGESTHAVMRQEMNIDPSVCARGLPRDPQGRRRLHPLVARAAEALETAGVTWALLRGEHDLGDPRGDVDILVDSPRGLGAVEQALRPLGVVAVPQVGAGAHRLFVGYHRPTRRWIEFDVEWDLDFGSQLHFTLNWLAPALRSGAARAVLARRRRSPDLPGMWVLHPDDAFWALLLHVIIDKGTVKDHHADRLVALCAAGDAVRSARAGGHRRVPPGLGRRPRHRVYACPAVVRRSSRSAGCSPGGPAPGIPWPIGPGRWSAVCTGWAVPCGRCWRRGG